MARARSVRTEYRTWLRARIVLATAAGQANAAIAGELGVHVDTVRKWRRRFAEGRLLRTTVIELAIFCAADEGLPLVRLRAGPLPADSWAGARPVEPGGTSFDATDIDEILTLRTLALTDDERRQAARPPAGLAAVEPASAL